MMIKDLLLFACFIAYGVNADCNICIIGSTCGDDYIHFNISISYDCRPPIYASFSYDTDVEAEKHHINKVLWCQNCYFDLTVDPIRDAWDYILTLNAPTSTKACSTRRARCGGYTSRYIWIGTVSLSGVFIVLGVLLCSIRYCRMRKQPPEVNTIQ